MKLHSSPIAVFTLAAALSPGAQALADPVTYTVDPTHTYPSFAADHIGLSVWRGKFNHTTGAITLDRGAGSGKVHIVVDMASVDFGLESLNKIARGPKFFDIKQYPRAVYDGKLDAFVGGKPTRVDGRLTLHGVTRPLTLKIESFKCIPMMLDKSRTRCGAEASAHLERDTFDLDFGKAYGFDMTVTLYIQVEALSPPKSTPMKKESRR